MTSAVLVSPSPRCAECGGDEDTCECVCECDLCRIAVWRDETVFLHRMLRLCLDCAPHEPLPDEDR